MVVTKANPPRKILARTLTANRDEIEGLAKGRCVLAVKLLMLINSPTIYSKTRAGISSQKTLQNIYDCRKPTQEPISAYQEFQAFSFIFLLTNFLQTNHMS